MIKVLVVDDHAVVRRGLLQILSEAPDITVAAEAASGREALQALDLEVFDVLVLDISLPDMDGIEVLKQAHSRQPGLAVLILSIHPEKQYALRVLKAGAAGYLSKDSSPDELVSAIRKVASGQCYVSLSLAERLAERVGPNAPAEPAYETLSDREYEVMCLLAAGKTVSEIANELSLGVTTVSSYRTRILHKLDLKNTAEIIRYALERGLV
ncbi:MAG: response regulator transcription factor [Chloroflexi bacterium]|nr:response regulator transcription factor [Chloroflexota bacterium]